MAISAEHARAWVNRFGTLDELAQGVCARLLAPAAEPIGHGRLDEFPEDVVIASLQDREIRDAQRQAVARGWKQAYDTVQPILDAPELESSPDGRQRLQEPFTRVFRVAEITGHPLLRGGVRAALPLVVATPSYASSRQVQQVVAAAIAYPDEVDRETWIRALHTKEEIAAFAFRMLLGLDFGCSPKIANHFACLLEKQFVEGWNLDAWFLGEYVRQAGMATALKLGIEQFIGKYPNKRDDVLRNGDGNLCWPEDTVAEITDGHGRQLRLALSRYNRPISGVASSLAFYVSQSQDALWLAERRVPPGSLASREETGSSLSLPVGGIPRLHQFGQVKASRVNKLQPECGRLDSSCLRGAADRNVGYCLYWMLPLGKAPVSTYGLRSRIPANG